MKGIKSVLCVCLVSVGGGCAPDADPEQPDSVCRLSGADDLRGREVSFSLKLDRQDALESSETFRGKLRIAPEPFDYSDNRQRFGGSSLDHVYDFGVEVMPEDASQWTMISVTQDVTSDVNTSHASLSCGRRGGFADISPPSLYMHELVEPFGEDLEPGIFEPLGIWYKAGQSFEAVRRADSKDASSVSGVTLTIE